MTPAQALAITQGAIARSSTNTITVELPYNVMVEACCMLLGDLIENTEIGALYAGKDLRGEKWWIRIQSDKRKGQT